MQRLEIERCPELNRPALIALSATAALGVLVGLIAVF